MCIQQGDAVFTIEARVRTSAATSYELQINDPQRRSVTHAGYSIEAQTLDPYPFTINPIEPEEYRLTVRLDRE